MATLLGLTSRPAIYMRVYRGQIPAKRFGKRDLRFVESEIAQLIQRLPSV
jgi:predicted DNA-binding transcriptional regulator AlpA